ncbi:unnamed protein product [Brachionus calyciflorus]|uniref:Uncharacterized protein n=1 Tax=Brachionus calyciflorus TaxID=104777 RepID=A0A813VUY7_9BILA|nr:unnamed protein product [Brachionus calyciflorus]
MNLIVFLALLITSIVLSQSNEIISEATRARVHKRKIDFCSYEANSDLFQSFLNLDIKKLGTSIGLAKSVFSFQSTTLCDIDKRLSNILDKLHDISNDFKSKIECMTTKSFDIDLSNKFDHFINTFEQFYKTSNKISVKNEIVTLCLDKSEGINRIYSLFQSSLKENEVIKNIKNCGHYESDYIEKWVKKVKEFSSMILFIVKGCEEASEKITEFNKDQFATDLNYLIQYYTETFIIKSFFKDNGEYGMKSRINAIAKGNSNAKSIANLLNKTYRFFYWSAVYFRPLYQNWRYGHTNPMDIFCGSELLKPLEYRHVIISWCVFPTKKIILPDSIEIKKIKKAKILAEVILKKNEGNISFVDVNLCLDNKPDEYHGNLNIYQLDTSMSKDAMKREFFYFYVAISTKEKFQEKKFKKFQNSAILFPL